MRESRAPMLGRRRRAIHRLVLWNIDLTLLDVTKVTRAAYAEAFAAITGRPLVQLPQQFGAMMTAIRKIAAAVDREL